MARTIAGPDGRAWTVRRHWARRPKWRWLVRLWRSGPGAPRRRRGRGLDVGDILTGLPGDEGCGVAVLGFVAVAAALVLFILFGLPALIFLAETVWALLLLAGGIVARVLFRRPWTIEASDGRETRTWQVAGWATGARAIEEIAGRIRAGGPLPDRLVAHQFERPDRRKPRGGSPSERQP